MKVLKVLSQRAANVINWANSQTLVLLVMPECLSSRWLQQICVEAAACPARLVSLCPLSSHFVRTHQDVSWRLPHWRLLKYDFTSVKVLSSVFNPQTWGGRKVNADGQRKDEGQANIFLIFCDLKKMWFPISSTAPHQPRDMAPFEKRGNKQQQQQQQRDCFLGWIWWFVFSEVLPCVCSCRDDDVLQAQPQRWWRWTMHEVSNSICSPECEAPVFPAPSCPSAAMSLSVLRCLSCRLLLLSSASLKLVGSARSPTRAPLVSPAFLSPVSALSSNSDSSPSHYASSECALSPIISVQDAS